jgi:hypothetical protein
VRSLPLLILVELLSVLLVTTSPVGTGSGVHHDQLLDALVPHVHLVAGRIIESDSFQPALEPTNGPVLGAAAGASAGSVGAGWLPALAIVLLLPPRPLVRRLRPAHQLAPAAHFEAPPDPPPSAHAA